MKQDPDSEVIATAEGLVPRSYFGSTKQAENYRRQGFSASDETVCRTCGGPGFLESQGDYYPCGSCNTIGIQTRND